MKILVLSDVHLEFSPLPTDAAGADVVVLAGDIHLGTRALPWIAEAFGERPVIYVPGNHEFYRGEHTQVLRDLRAAAAARTHLHVLDCDSVILGGVEFLGTTLWTDFALYGESEAVRRASETEAAGGLSDFAGLIRYEHDGRSRLFTPADSVRLHEEARAWLEDRLRAPSERKRVVVTHHLPSERSVPSRYLGNPLSPAFASRLDTVVALADVWIHGHTHDGFDYRVGSCRVVCNPRGYVVRDRPPENPRFDPGCLVEI